MFNPYAIILGLFIVAGISATLWGLRVIVVSRKTLAWPAVDGVIVESTLSSEHDDLLPHIMFEYRVQDQSYQQLFKFPKDIAPTQEFARSYIDKYPQGASVNVYYNPEKPDIATLEPGLAKGDWLVLVLGLSMLILGVLLYFFAS